MKILAWLMARLRPGSAPGLGFHAPGRRVVAALGVDPAFQAWAESVDGPLSALWHGCPRPDWLVDLAIRAGLERGAVADAIDDCAELLESTAPPERIAALRRAARSWAAQRHGGAAPTDLFAEIVIDAFDSAPDLVAARRARRAPVQRRYPLARLSGDIAERGFLGRLADVVRKRIRLSRVELALFGRPGAGTPYR